MYSQRDPRWSRKKLGFGTGTIGRYGCYLTALAWGLERFGWDFTPDSLNQMLKDKGLYTGEFKNYIDVHKLNSVLPGIFKNFVKIEPWQNLPIGDCVVLGKVDAKIIGGTGTHFVEIDVKSGWINDPWDGKEYSIIRSPILGLRIFYIKKKEINMPKLTEDEQNALDAIKKAPETIKIAGDPKAKFKEDKLESTVNTWMGSHRWILETKPAWKKDVDSLNELKPKIAEWKEKIKNDDELKKKLAGKLDGKPDFSDILAKVEGLLETEDQYNNEEQFKDKNEEIEQLTTKLSDCMSSRKEALEEITDLKEQLKDKPMPKPTTNQPYPEWKKFTYNASRAFLIGALPVLATQIAIGTSIIDWRLWLATTVSGIVTGGIKGLVEYLRNTKAFAIDGQNYNHFLYRTIFRFI